MNKKRVAMIGCGGIGGYHLSHLLQFGDIIDLVGFCDLIPERAQGFAEQAGCGETFTDFRKMYDAVHPDAVFICVPPTCHGEIEFETIERSIPFFVEKPLTLDLKLAQEILRRWRAEMEAGKFEDISTRWCDMKGGCVSSKGYPRPCTEDRLLACIKRWLQQPAEG